MCEWFRAPRRALVPLPSGLDLKDASLVEPAAVARHACHMGGIGSSTRVAVVGAGAIGILAAASARAMGAPEVGVEARHQHQHEARERLGAANPSGAYDVVVETAGSESGIHRAVELASPGATVVHLGVYGDIRWPMQEAFMKEVALRASLGYCGHHGRREFAESADMLAAQPELAHMLITHRFPIEDAAEAYRVAQDRSRGVFRVVVEP
jgi:2-desacetyl-2-hydroxyethyl bacteriochlorophyllide A dehydrogenase